MNWDLATRIGMPLVSAVLGVAISRVVEKRVKLIVYYGHVSEFRIKAAEGPDTFIHAHSVVIRNSGRQSAKNVRIGHGFLPDHVHIQPSVAYSIEALAGGTKDIVVPQLVPGEQITISYLYFPPLVWRDVTASVKSDEGLARVINVLPTRQFSRWITYLLGVLVALGVAFLLYMGISLVLYFVSKGPTP